MKFNFTIDFQYDVLRYTVQDKNGYKLLELYNDTYFSLTEHAIIAYALKKYYKYKKKIPGRVVFTDYVTEVFSEKQFVNNLLSEDRKKIIELTKNLYKDPVKDGDDILEKTEKFIKYIDLKTEIESVDLLDDSQYDQFVGRIQKAIAPKLRKIEERGNFLVKDIRSRQIERKENSPIIPTPFWQINMLTNAGGYASGSIMVVLDRAKKLKTTTLVNIAAGYFKKKNVLVIDLDNGEEEFMLRVEQCIVSKTKREVLSGDYDKDIRRIIRKRKKLKRELVVKRLPALITTANDIKSYIRFLYNEYGFKTEVLIVDFIAKMGCISGKESLHERISEAYIDIGNLALEEEIQHVWTAQHINKEGIKNREATTYLATDIAGSLDISRYAHAIFGLNRYRAEEENNLQRLQVVDQRDGVKGYAVFRTNIEHQKLIELNKKERERYVVQFGNRDQDDDGEPKERENDL